MKYSVILAAVGGVWMGVSAENARGENARADIVPFTKQTNPESINNAFSDPTAGGGAATTQPTADPQVAELIEQLADPDFRRRESAAASLEQRGKAVLPALKEAMNSDDPEIRSAAGVLVDKLENPPKPALPAGRGIHGNAGMIRIHGNANVQMKAVSSTVENGRHTINVQENDRQMTIVEDADGIVVTITEPIDGKLQTNEYKARNAEELKKNHPAAAEVYEQNARPANGIQLDARQMDVQQRLAEARARVAEAEARAAAMREQMEQRRQQAQPPVNQPQQKEPAPDEASPVEPAPEKPAAE